MTTQQFAPEQAGFVIPEFTVGDRLRKARELTGLSQGEFARQIGVSKGTVANYENDTTPAKHPALVMWSMRTRVPLEWLTGESQPPPPVSQKADGTASSGWKSRQVRRESKPRIIPAPMPIAA